MKKLITSIVESTTKAFVSESTLNSDSNHRLFENLSIDKDELRLEEVKGGIIIEDITID